MSRRLRRGRREAALVWLTRLQTELHDLTDRVPLDSTQVYSAFAERLAVKLVEVQLLRELLGVTDPETPHIQRAEKILQLPRRS